MCPPLRTSVVGILLNAAAIPRLARVVLLQHDEHWQRVGRYMFSLDSSTPIRRRGFDAWSL